MTLQEIIAVRKSEEECERYWHGFPSPEEIEPIVRRLKSLRFSG